MDEHVEFVLLAEFDIDKGSLLSIQHPRPTGIDEQCLAELMLPDGAHNREEDWTVFFINRARESELSAAKEPAKVIDVDTQLVLEAWTYQISENDSAWELLDDDQKLLILEPTKLIVSQRNREQLLVIAHDSEFECAQQEPFFVVILTPVAAVGLRLSSAEDEDTLLKYLEKLKLVSPDIIKEVEKQEEAVIQEEAPPFLYCLNLVRTKKDASFTRGAKVKALALCSRHRWAFHVFKPLLILTLESFFSTNDPKTIAGLYTAINSMDVAAMPNYLLQERLIRRGGLTFPDSIFSTACILDNVKIPVRIPLTMLDEEVGQPSIVPLIAKFGAGIMTIFNALLTERRIIFLGYAHPASEVCDMVLAALAMVAPPLASVIKRTFPYTNLVNLDFLQMPSYLSGTTNLLFQQRTEWWDVLCNISDGTVTLSDKLVAELKEAPDTFAAEDAAVFSDLMYSLDQHYSNAKLIDIMQRYALRLVNMARGVEEFRDEATRLAALDSNRKRLDKIKRTVQFREYIALVEERKAAAPVQGVDLDQEVRRLTTVRLSDEDMLRLFQALISGVVSDDQITYFLQFFPHDFGGLLPVAIGLFHENEAVRGLAVELLARVEKNRYGKLLLSKLNHFVLLAYKRNQYLVG